MGGAWAEHGRIRGILIRVVHSIIKGYIKLRVRQSGEACCVDLFSSFKAMNSIAPDQPSLLNQYNHHHISETFQKDRPRHV